MFYYAVFQSNQVYIYAKTLIMDLKVLKNESEISVLCKTHFNVIALSNR